MADNYRLSAEAAADLSRIRMYIQEVDGEQAANRIMGRLLDSFEHLAEHPYMGVSRGYLPDIRIHTAPNTRYVILYFPGDGEVEISRVIHGRQDIERFFR